MRGAMDFSRLDPCDNKWWLKLAWVQEEIARQDALDVMRLQHMQWCHLVTANGLEGESANSIIRAANDYLRSYRKLQLPWIDTQQDTDDGEGVNQDNTDSKLQHSEVDDLVERYRQQFGSPGEERYERMIAEWRRHLTKRESETEQ